MLGGTQLTKPLTADLLLSALGTHYIDSLHFLTGQKVQEVSYCVL